MRENWGMRGVVRAAVVLVVLGSPSATVASGFFDFLGGLGEALGRPVGGLLKGATGPTIEKARSEVGIAVADVDGRLAGRIDQVGLIAKGTVEGVDHVLAARIAQVNGVGDDLIRVAASNVQVTVAQVDAVAKARIAQVSTEAQKRIEQVDEVAKARLEQVDALAQGVVHEVDGAVEARLDQVDEIAGRRLGNVDTIVSKQLINVEAMALKVVCILGLVVTLVLLMVRAFREWSDMLEGGGSFFKKLRRSAWPFLARGTLAFLLAGAFFWLAQELPGGSALRAREIRFEHERGFRASLERFDLTAGRFHASQLAFLADTDTAFDVTGRALCPLARALNVDMISCFEDSRRPLSVAEANQALWRVTLLRDVLTQPGKLLTREGRNGVLVQLEQLDPSRKDVELSALRAVVEFYGIEDGGELAALVAPLRVGCENPSPAPTSQVFHQLACDTLVSVSLALPSAAWLAATNRAVPAFERPKTDAGRQAYVDGLSAFIDKSATAHAMLLDAQVNVCRTSGNTMKPSKDEGAFTSAQTACRTAENTQGLSAQVAKTRRQEAASLLRKEWAALMLTAKGEAQESLLLELDDAALSFALAAQASDEVLPPPLAQRKGEEKLRSLPPRVALARRAFGGKGDNVQAMAGLVEAQRYLALESLEFVILEELLRKGPRDVASSVRLATALEMKGLLNEAQQRGWVGADELKVAFAAAGPVAIPVKRMMP